MFINSIDNAYYITQLKAAGYLKSLEPVNPVNRVRLNTSENFTVDKIDPDKNDKSNLSNSVSNNSNHNQSVNKLLESFENTLDMAAQQKISKANSVDESKIAEKMDLDSEKEISAERKGYILHLPEDQYKSMVNSNSKNILVNNQVRLKEYYMAQTKKQGVLVNLAI